MYNRQNIYPLAITICALMATTMASTYSPQAMATESVQSPSETFARQQAELDAQRAILEARRADLEKAVMAMQQASQKMARLRNQSGNATNSNNTFVWVSDELAFSAEPSITIGVILASTGNDTSLKIIGLTPDGPALRAGLEKNDSILSINGKDLLVLPASERMQTVLSELTETEVGDVVELTVLRDDKPLNVTVVAEKRSPAALHSIIRLPHPQRPALPIHPAAAPGHPEAPVVPDAANVVIINRSITRSNNFEDGSEKQVIISVQDQNGTLKSFATEDLEKHITLLEKHLENMDINIDMENFPGVPDIGKFEVVIAQAAENASLFFDSNMVNGLELAALNPALGEYFTTDRGILVINARKNNSLNLMSGDVITAVNSSEVLKPADLMRKIRFLDDGETIQLEVIRRGQAQTIESQPTDKTIRINIDKSKL